MGADVARAGADVSMGKTMILILPAQTRVFRRGMQQNHFTPIGKQSSVRPTVTRGVLLEAVGAATRSKS